MSFILDALRKSDARRRQGGPPGLNSPEPSPPPGRRRRGGWRALAGIAVVVLAAAASVAVLRPQWLPPQLAAVLGERPAERAVQEPAPAPAEPVTEDQAATEQQLTAAEIRARMTRGGAGNRPESTAENESNEAETVVEGSAPPEQAVVDRRQPRSASPDRSVSRQAPQRETAPMQPDEGLKELERRLAEARQRGEQAGRPEDVRSRGADGGPADRARRGEDDASPSAAGRREAATDQSSPEPLNTKVAEYLHQWELPLAARRNLPDLTLNIHVYSPREEERFVLVNGERYVAGDSLAQGVRLVDIRREGAIVDFRSHRFLLEPQ